MRAPRLFLLCGERLWARRLLVIALTLIPAALAAHEMRRSIGLDGISALEGVYLALFISLFAWIAFGFAFIALLALVLATGLIVDDAIVVLENTQRLQDKGLGRRAAAPRSGASGGQ
mgnify:CR=1 FL=1